MVYNSNPIHSCNRCLGFSVGFQSSILFLVLSLYELLVVVCISGYSLHGIFSRVSYYYAGIWSSLIGVLRFTKL